MAVPADITISRGEAVATSASQAVPYHITRSVDGDDWTVRDPSGGATWRAATYVGAIEIARELTECARKRPPERGLAC
jgi:hypothetical protein